MNESESARMSAAPPTGVVRVGNDEPGLSETTGGERFLQQALGTQGDVRVPALALSLAVMVAVVVVAVKRLRHGKADRFLDEAELDGEDWDGTGALDE